jgi:hypothetical protein
VDYVSPFNNSPFTVSSSFWRDPMTRISCFAVMFIAAVAFSVTNANAQCASCSQGYAPSFTQVNAAPSYAVPVYAQQGVSYAAPQSSATTACGCAPDASVSVVAPVSYAAPISADCGCGAPAATVSTGSDCCVAPARTSRVRLIGRRRAQNCCCN